MDYLVKATDDYTGAQAQELANSTLILALAGDRTGWGSAYNTNADFSQSENSDKKICVDRTLIDSAIAEMSIERKIRIGFHAS